METEFAADATFDCVMFRILPENRYEARISSNENEEVVGHGPLDHLLEHLPSIKDQISNGSSDNFRLQLPTPNDRSWFTKATLSRFLRIIGSSDLKKAIAIGNEMSQLEEARKFHLSLYTQVEKGNKSSDASKNELLRAMDSRLAALTEELASAVNLSAGTTVSNQEMINLHNCCQHFGDAKTRNLISKLLERSQKNQIDNSSEKPKPSIPFVSKSDYASKSAGNPQESNPVKAVKYNASPAKAAEIERQSSTESDESSFSSEDDQPSVERSRTMARSASPRRSASPMRKIQIGRSGSRRTPALAIRSLPYFPPRIASCKDAGSGSDSDVVEEPIKKTEVNVTRISVQDAISLFERKQKDDVVDGQKKSMNDGLVTLNKAVLRRWSSGMGESRKSLTQNKQDNTSSEDKVNSFEEDGLRPAEAVPDTDHVFEHQKLDDTVEDDVRSKGNVELESNLDLDDGQGCQTDDTSEKLDSVEWTRQKEAELNQMLMKFAQYNLSNPKNAESDNVKNHESRLPKKGEVNGHRKDEKLKGETTGKKVEKQSELRAKKKVLDKPKAEKSSPKVSDVGRKNSTTSRAQNVNATTGRAPNITKNTSMSFSTKKESPKPDVLKRAPPKPSPLPATRKSWPSTPSPRALGTVPAKTSRPKSQLPGSGQKSQPLVTRQKPQSPVLRSSPKTETTPLYEKDVKKAQVVTKKNVRKVDDSKTRLPSKNGKMVKTKTDTVVEEGAAVSPVKAVVRKKGTKKSSVVPLEAKPPNRKVSGSTPAGSPLKKTEISVQTEPTLSECEILVSTPVKVGTVISDTVHPVAILQESEPLNDDIEQPMNDNEHDISVEAHVQDDEPTERVTGSPGEIQSEQERVISPAAWEETDQLDPTIQNGNWSSPAPAIDDVAAVSSGTRVRHSLSQMLLEESSEPDIVEWGNAENPPAMIYQKDAPKGLKRLLKFTRKNKGETNGSTWASPYTSEGEDDGDEYRSLGKRNSDNLLKVALHSKNHGEGFVSDTEPLSARSNASNSSVRSASRFQDGHNLKGTRSFFSLSAFRGNKS
ncbi:hypothetical protein RND81_10G092600 [Saponaria officinalis]|uniref:COP1-interacting protein 7 n=1 Tax=Saponaria officinalis TaxID=3572 RepID=A0AAW1I0W2_SAPOF